MIKHYFTLALRNLLKYRMQSAISILGLAVGFTCFALATMWIRHEMTFDTHHPGAERIYMLYGKSFFKQDAWTSQIYPTLATAMKKHLPEVEAGVTYQRPPLILTVDDTEIMVTRINADSCLLQLMNITLLEGSWGFLHNERQIAVTEAGARKLFGTAEGVMGRRVSDHNKRELTVAALLHIPKPEHSNLNFEVWKGDLHTDLHHNNWSLLGYYNCIRLREGVSVDAFREKLENFKEVMRPNGKTPLFEGIHLIPLTEYRYSEINDEQVVQFHYLILFSVIGGLVILCSLFNYLALFITRMEIRRREMELRRFCGSSRWSLVVMMMVEYGVLIAVSGLFGMAFVEWCMKPFRELTGVTGNIYAESGFYFLWVFLCSLLLLIPFAWHSGSLRLSQRGKRFLLYRASLFLQLFISILFIFAVCVLLKQVHYLKHDEDLGFDRENMAIVMNAQGAAYVEIADHIAQLPCVDTVYCGSPTIFPSLMLSATDVWDWEGKAANVKAIHTMVYPVNGDLVDFYNFRLLEGEWPMNKGMEYVVLNESAVKAIGLVNPVGKKIKIHNKLEKTIVGVVKDFYVDAPTVPVMPSMMWEREPDNSFSNAVSTILIKFHPGEWNTLKEETEEIIRKVLPDNHMWGASIANVEELYDGYLKSENMLIKLLVVVSLVCVAVCSFGIFSLISLSCEQRRKEIAIRKVNGAKMGDILRMFAREYLLLLIAASVVAFPMGYVLMRRWLEEYVRQTNIPVWIYLIIFLGVALIIALCIGWQVWQAARQNPAEVIKSE